MPDVHAAANRALRVVISVLAVVMVADVVMHISTWLQRVCS